MAGTFLGAFSGGTTGIATLPTIGPGMSMILLAGNATTQSATLTASDQLGNSYANRGAFNDGFGSSTRAMLDCVTPGTLGAPVVTLGGGTELIVLLYAGLASYSAGSFAGLLITPGGTPSLATDGCATGSITPSSYPSILIGGSFCASGSALNPGTGFTPRFNRSGGGFPNADSAYAQDKRLTSGSSIFSFTALLASGDVCVMGAAYIESADVAPSVQQAPGRRRIRHRQGGLAMGLNLLEWF